MVKAICSCLYLVAISVIFFSFVSADVISVNSGGDLNLVVENNNVDVFFSSSEVSNVVIVLPVCGNGILETGEGCDDGNIISGDGCSASCVVEVVEDDGDSGGSSGGGGGGGAVSEVEIVLNDTSELISNIDDLIIVPESLNLPATVGIQTSAKLSITNNGNTDLELNLSVLFLKDMVSFDNNIFILSPGESEILEFFIMPNESGIYTGKFVFSSGKDVLEFPVILNVNSKLSLFDIMLDLNEESRFISFGEKVVGQISLIQMGLQSDMDVSMNYVIKDFSGKTYLMQTETIKVNKEKSYSHVFETDNLSPGDYIVGVEVVYAGGVATASSQFRVESEEIFPWWVLLVAVLIVFLIVLVSAKFYKKGKR